jgi:PPOX class probable F420-dependent enzyme
MAALTGERLREFLQGRYIATLATLNDDGTIHLTAVWYLFQDGAFFVATHSSSRKARNVRARRQASLMVDTRRTQMERGVTAVCTVEVLSGEPAAAINGRIHGRYMSEAALADPAVGPVMDGLDDVTLRLSPLRWISWDMAALDAQAFGGTFSRNPDYLLPLD